MNRKTRPILVFVGASCATALLLTATSARADVTTTYNGNRCVPSNNFDGTTAVTYPAGGGIKVSQAATVVCPIEKMTSNLGVSTDRILGVDFFKMTSVVLPDSCTLKIFWSTTETLGDNLVAQRTGNRGIPGAAQLNIGPTSPAVTAYWWDNESWFYGELYCSLQANQGIASYQVREAGTKQTTRIFSPSSCKPVPGTPWGQDNFNGLVESGGGLGMHYQCGIAATAQFSILRSSNNFGFSIGDTWGAWPKQTGSGFPGHGVPAFPSVLYPSTALPAASPFTNSGGFIVATGLHLWVTKNLDPALNGDFAIVSYRTTGSNPF